METPIWNSEPLSEHLVCDEVQPRGGLLEVVLPLGRHPPLVCYVQ